MPGYFSIDEPEAHKMIYGHGAQWAKAESYEAWHVGPGLANLFSERDPAHHAAMRRKIASMYSMTSLISYEPYVDDCIGLLMSSFSDLASSSSPLDLAHWLQCYAFDVISMITFGERFGFLDEGRDIGNLIQNIDFVLTILSHVGVYPWLMPILHRLTYIFGGRKELYHQRFTNERIAFTRREKQGLSENGPVYMVRKFIDAQRKDDVKGITDWDISANAGSNIGAGSDSTATSLSTILYYVYRSPQVLQKVRKAIDDMNFTSVPTFKTVQQMPYLQAVIKESLRMHPATGLPLWREVPKGGAIICGQFFPEGTNVGVNSWVAHRNRTAYGPDADEFRPERWLEGTAASDGKMLKDESFMTFGLGSRTCIGKNISLLEMNKVIPVLVRDYEFEFLAKDGSPETSKYLAGINRWFVKPARLYARVSRRIHATS